MHYVRPDVFCAHGTYVSLLCSCPNCSPLHQREDVGPVHERASAVFTVHLAQYAPAVVAGEEDRVVVGGGGPGGGGWVGGGSGWW